MPPRRSPPYSPPVRPPKPPRYRPQTRIRPAPAWLPPIIKLLFSSSKLLSVPGLPLSYTPDVAKLSHGAGVLEIFVIFLREVGAGRRGRRPLQASLQAFRLFVGGGIYPSRTASPLAPVPQSASSLRLVLHTPQQILRLHSVQLGQGQQVCGARVGAARFP